MKLVTLAKLALLAVAAFAAAGCNAAGFLAYGAAGGENHAAEFVPPKEPTLVLVENERAAATAYSDCDHVSTYIEQDLHDNNVAPVVSRNSLIDLRERDPIAYRGMSIVEIAKATGAKQVVYVTLSDYDSDTAAGSDATQWKAQAKVRIVDAQTGLNRWPLDLTEGEPLKAHTQLTASDPYDKSFTAHQDLDKKLATQIGQLFHPWVQDEETSEEINRY